MVRTLGAAFPPRAPQLRVETGNTSNWSFDVRDEGALNGDLLHPSVADSAPGLLSPPMTDSTSRRESFASSGTMFPFKREELDGLNSMQSLPPSNLFVDAQGGAFSNRNAYLPFNHGPQNMYDSSQVGPGCGWAVNTVVAPASNPPTPFAPLDRTPVAGLDPDFSAFHRHVSSQAPFTGPVDVLSPLSQGDQSMASTPRHVWSADPGESASVSKEMDPEDVVFRPHHGDMRRRDGIRKKNARFEIPAGRTLHNIDELISHSKDDTEVKELKQQKRLLRNRQAALDSRQRKKMHTERLEEEKKRYVIIVGEMTDQIETLRGTVESIKHERQGTEGAAERFRRRPDLLSLSLNMVQIENRLSHQKTMRQRKRT